MVGVPRSKGCNTCRKRRVRCDEGKPTCQRCKKAHRECHGYEREMPFRNLYTSQSLGPVGPSTMQQISLDKAGGSSKIIFVTQPPPELGLSAFQWEIYVSRMFDNFIWKSYGAGWLDLAAQGKLGNLSRDAVKALSQFSFGQSNRILSVEEQGVVHYRGCLTLLAEELKSGTAFAQGEHHLICPILILTMLACIQTDRKAAFWHLGAIAKLLKLCGPEPFQQRHLRSAFEAARSTLLVPFLFLRKKLFLEDPLWQTVPWALEPASSKRPQSHLLDIFVMIPGLLEEERCLDDQEDDNEKPYHSAEGPISPSLDADLTYTFRRVALRDRIATHLERLYRWRWDWQRENGQYLNTVALDNDDDDYEAAWSVLMGDSAYPMTASKDPKEVPRRLLFPSPVHANDIMLYNATLMWLIALLWKVDPSPSGAARVIEGCARGAAPEVPSPSTYGEGGAYIPYYEPLSFQPLQAPGVSTSIRDPAIEICRVYDWLARHHSSKQTTSSSPSSSFASNSPSSSSSPPSTASTSRSSFSLSSSSGSDQEQICLYMFPLGMARCVLEGVGASPSMPSSSDPGSNLGVDVETGGLTASFIVSEWIRGMLDLSPVTRGYGAAGGSCNIVGFGSYITTEALYPPRTMPADPDVHMGGGLDELIESIGQYENEAESWW